MGKGWRVASEMECRARVDKMEACPHVQLAVAVSMWAGVPWKRVLDQRAVHAVGGQPCQLQTWLYCADSSGARWQST